MKTGILVHVHVWYWKERVHIWFAWNNGKTNSESTNLIANDIGWEVKETLKHALKRGEFEIVQDEFTGDDLTNLYSHELLIANIVVSVIDKNAMQFKIQWKDGDIVTKTTKIDFDEIGMTIRDCFQSKSKYLKPRPSEPFIKNHNENPYLITM